MYTKLFLGTDITDYTGGYVMYSRRILENIDFSNFNNTSYGFLLEIKYKAKKIAHKIVEVPIVFEERESGDSKLPSDIAIENLKLVLKLRFGKHDS
ncbi:MAG: hypothetical protein LBT80_02665 [Lactobacillaceae bacterium]|jgi:dolichol-phosphate mannosyltransferase|nr:hypothetical protein [Lactobacillaceae bacterium]